MSGVDPGRLRRICPGCGTEVTWPRPDEPVPLARVACPGCGGEQLFSLFEKMDVALSEACNYRCIMCRRPSDPGTLKTGDVIAVMRQAAAIGLQVVSFCGGEPFIHQGFVRIAREAVALGLKVQVTTNGGLVTAEQIERLRGLDCLTLSIDAPEETHDAIRGAPGAFRQACRVLRMAIDAGITRGTNTVIQRVNADQLEELFFGLLEETGGRLDYVRHAPVEVLADTEHLMVAPDQVPRVQQQLRRIADECDRRGIYFSHRRQLLEHLTLYLDKRTRHRPLGGCKIPRKFIGYSHLGFYLCWHQEHSIRAGSLVEALESEVARQAVAAAHEEVCVGCNALTYSWDEEWNEAILAGKLVQDGGLLDQVTTVHGAWSSDARSASDSAPAAGSASGAPGFLAGINWPYLGDDYNHDLCPNERYPDWGCAFSPVTSFRYLAICRELGFDAVRIWLCEDGEGLRLDKQGRIVGVIPQLLDAVRIIQDGARLAGLKVYWTLLDGNAWARNNDPVTGQVVRDEQQRQRFAELVVQPMARQLDPEVAFALELINEPECLSDEVLGGAGLPWPTIVQALCALRLALHQVLPATPVTSGTQAVFLPRLLADLAAGGASPVDAVDIHAYYRDGGLPGRGELPVEIGDMDLWAGECGESSRGNRCSEGQYLVNYLHNARDLGYRAAFLWKLLGHLVRHPTDGDPAHHGFGITRAGQRVRDLLLHDLHPAGSEL